MHVPSINLLANQNLLSQKIKDLFIPTAIQRKVILAVGLIFALYVAYRTYFNDIKPIADGKYEYKDSSGIHREGTFKNGQLNGPGKKKYPDGTIEHGFFENDQLKAGNIIYPNGRIFGLGD